ncbi:hypothetical protein B0H11DRAFT_656652 [Mycena galericulata]|nr:hypothetical protein B0H11DRAFT_656652 [Mycena galericulata]
MTALPNEMWLRIFSLMDSTKSLGCVVLVCRKFHMLATEALVRNITWRSSTVALKHLKFLEAEPSRTHLVRSLSLTLKSSQIDIDSDPEYIYIFGSIQSFSKLRHLKLSTGTVPDVLYRTLQNLPSLTQITFQACAIPPAPPFFPYSFPSTIPPAPIETTILSVSKLRPFHMGNFFLDAVTVPLAYHLPNLRTFVTDAIGIQIPTTASAQISSLTLNLPAVMSDIQPRLDVLLQRMPLLTDLTVSIAPSGNHPPHGTASTVSPGPAPPLPLLRTLSAPWPAAGHIVAGAPALEHLRVSSAIPKPGDAVWLLERLRAADAGAGLRSVALRLHTWDDEVLLAAARCLPACAVLEVAYQDGAPSDVRSFLFPPLFRAC